MRGTKKNLVVLIAVIDNVVKRLDGALVHVQKLQTRVIVLGRKLEKERKA